MKAKEYFERYWPVLKQADSQQVMITKLVEVFHEMMGENQRLALLRGNTPNAIQAAVKETKQKWVAFLSRIDEQLKKEVESQAKHALILLYNSLPTRLEFNTLLRTFNTPFYESLCAHDKSFRTPADEFNFELRKRMNELLAQSARDLGFPITVDKKTGNLKSL